jgi:hypothetical protein
MNIYKCYCAFVDIVITFISPVGRVRALKDIDQINYKFMFIK